MNKITIIIVSNDISIRRGLLTIFKSESIFDVKGGFSTEEAVKELSLAQPDVILLDIYDDVQKYSTLIKRFKNECPCSLILALIGDDQVNSITGILAQGLDGCVPRGIIRVNLIRVVEMACRVGVICLPGAIKKTSFFNNTIQLTTIPSNVAALTRREKEVYHLMTKNYSNREIANKLYISEPTVKTHVSSILRKLGKKNRAQAIVYSYQIGLQEDSR